MNSTLVDTRFKRNVLVSYASQLGTVGAAFVVTTIITRYAGIDVYGMVALLASLSAILSNLLTFRTNEAVISFYKRGMLEGDLSICRLALVAGLILDLLVGVIIFTLIYFCAPLIADLFFKGAEVVNEISTYSWVVLATFVRGTAIGLLAAEERFNFINVTALFEAIWKVILLSCFLLYGEDFGLQSVVYASLISSVSITIVLYQVPLREIFFRLRRLPIPYHMVADYFKFSISTFISSSLKAGNQHADTLILGLFVGSAEVGFYSLFRQFLAPTTMISSPFSSQIYPKFVACIVEGKRNLIAETIRNISRILLACFAVVIIPISLILYFYGQWNRLDFTLDHLVTYGLMVLSTLLLQQLWWARPLSLSVDARWSIYAGLISSVVIIGCGFLLVWLCGLPGAAGTGAVSALLLTMFWGKKLGIVLK